MAHALPRHSTGYVYVRPRCDEGAGVPALRGTNASCGEDVLDVRPRGRTRQRAAACATERAGARTCERADAFGGDRRSAGSDPARRVEGIGSTCGLSADGGDSARRSRSSRTGSRCGASKATQELVDGARRRRWCVGVRGGDRRSPVAAACGIAATGQRSAARGSAGCCRRADTRGSGADLGGQPAGDLGERRIENDLVRAPVHTRCERVDGARASTPHRSMSVPHDGSLRRDAGLGEYRRAVGQSHGTADDRQ